MYVYMYALIVVWASWFWQDLFEGEKLTAAERKRMEINEKILQMAKDKHRFTYKDDSYHIPDGLGR